MKRYLQKKFELNHNLAEARIAVLKGAIEMLEKMEHFFTHEHLTKKGEFKVCYQPTIDDFLRKNPVIIDNIHIRGWFYIDSRWETVHFCDKSNNAYFEFSPYASEGHFIVDKKINLDMIGKAKNHFEEKLNALEKHIKTRAALESQLLDLADELITKFQDLQDVLKEWNQPMYDISEYAVMTKIGQF